MEDVLAVILIFGGATLFLLSISPVGRAIAERIRQGRTAPSEDVRAELDSFRDDLRGEFEHLQTEVGELAERLDFAERLLAKQREAERLPPR